MSGVDEEVHRLLERASDGDDSAIGEMIRRFEPEIRLIAHRQLGASLRPYLDSMDLAQSVHRDLLLGLREGKFKFSEKRQLLAFVTGLVRWKAARHWRKHRRQQRQSGVQLPSEGLADVIVSFQAKDDPENSCQERDQIEFALSHLTPSDRELIALRLEGYSTAEVARQLNLNSDVARVRLSRLRKKLKDAAWVTKLL